MDYLMLNGQVENLQTNKGENYALSLWTWKRQEKKE